MEKKKYYRKYTLSFEDKSKLVKKIENSSRQIEKRTGLKIKDITLGYHNDDFVKNKISVVFTV